MLLNQCTLSQQTDLVNKKQHTASKDQGREQAAQMSNTLARVIKQMSRVQMDTGSSPYTIIMWS